MDLINKARLTQLENKINIMKSFKVSDEEIEKSFSKDELDLIEKGAKANIGEIRDWGGKKYKKQPNGKWLEVSEHGMTKKEHKDKAEEHYKNIGKFLDENNVDYADKEQGRNVIHNTIASKLSDKEHSDEEVGLGKDQSDNKEDVDYSKFTDGQLNDMGNQLMKQELTDKVKDSIFNILKEKEKRLKKSLTTDIEKSEDSKEKKVAKVMREFKNRTLKDSHGNVVTDRDQAIAIAMSEAGLSKEKSIENDIEKASFEDIFKSHLNDLFYSENMKIKKSGKEFKEALNKQLLSKQTEIKSHREKLSKLIEEIGEQPTDKFDSWSRDGWEDKIIDFPMVYKYSYGLVSESGNNSQQVDDKRDLKNKYSDCVRQYVDDQKEVYYINTMLNNVKDSESYTFNVRQATLLGF